MQKLIVRRLASASERNQSFGFPVMGQFPQSSARASMTGIPFIPECSLTPDCGGRYSTASNGGFCVPSRIKSGQRAGRVAPIRLGQSQQVAPLMNVAGRASVQNNDRNRSQASKNTVANRVTTENRVRRLAGEGMERERATNALNKVPQGSNAASPRKQTRRFWATVRRGRKNCERHTAYRNGCANTGIVLIEVRAISVPTPAPEMKVNSK